MPKDIDAQNEATFSIRIHFCQNASWQGSIRWLEGKKTVFFRSMLEMSMLMFRALTAGSDAKVLSFPHGDSPGGEER